MTLYEQLGGATSVEKAVTIFYEKVLSDDNLIEFFEGANIDQLKIHQRNFLTVALGGPNIYEGRNMRKAHEHLKLNDFHYNLIKTHLSDSLKTVGANESQVEIVMEVVETLRNDVLNK